MTAMDAIRHPSFSKGHPRLQTTMRPARGKSDGDKSSRGVAVVVVATVRRRLAHAAWADGGTTERVRKQKSPSLQSGI